MTKNKILLTSTVAAILFAGNVTSFASNNDLLRMDVKPASAQDTLDVTFYTTGTNTNSVVSRKSDNKYVVLLPNVAGNSSVVPSLGGVKDLVTNIDVKNVNDGIGGYTKVTFSTVKPIKIQTSVKHTEPLTKAQQDYKNLIAQNNTPQAVKKPVSTATSKTTSQPKEQPAITKTNTQTTKTTPVQNKTVKPAAVVPAVSTTTKPVDLGATKKVQEQIVRINNNTNTKPVTPAKTSVLEQTNPKIQIENNNNVKDLKAVEETTPAKPEVNTQTKTVATKPVNTVAENQNSLPKNSNKWLLIAGAGILGLLGLGALKSVLSAITSVKKRPEPFNFNESINPDITINNEELKEVANDKNLNWQEKYKKYTQQSSQNKQKVYPFISKVESVDEQTFANVQESLINKEEKPVKQNNETTMPIISVNNKETTKENMESLISEMEHSLSQTPKISEPDTKNPYHSEDEQINKTLSKVKLKAFAKPKSLSFARRGSLGMERKILEASDIKEGKFVQLDRSILNISSRKSPSSVINSQGRFDVQKGYFNNNGETEMKKEKSDYTVSSLKEYLSILDTERSSSKSNHRAKEGMSNPIASNSEKSKVSKNFDGMDIKTEYKIDSERSISLATIDGVSAIVGQNGSGSHILKKFDRIIDSPLQVRKDYENIYIVRTGGFKCLVDVSNEKMGTLLEI